MPLGERNARVLGDESLHIGTESYERLNSRDVPEAIERLGLSYHILHAFIVKGKFDHKIIIAIENSFALRPLSKHHLVLLPA